MAYNKPLGFYTSVQHRAYWKISNTGQEIGTGVYASHKAEFPPFSAAPKYAQVKWPQKLSQTSHFHQSFFSHVFSPKNASHKHNKYSGFPKWDFITRVYSGSFSSSPVITLTPRQHWLRNWRGLNWTKWDEVHLPFPNTEVWGRIHLQIICFFLSAPTLQRVRALVIAFALLEWKTSTAFCMYSALYSLISVTNTNRKRSDFHQPTFKAFLSRAREYLWDLIVTVNWAMAAAKAVFHSLKYFWITARSQLLLKL